MLLVFNDSTLARVSADGEPIPQGGTESSSHPGGRLVKTVLGHRRNTSTPKPIFVQVCIVHAMEATRLHEPDNQYFKEIDELVLVL